MKACDWLRDNGFHPSEIVFGWWSYDEAAAAAAKSCGLNVVKRLDYYFIHDYDL